MLRKVPSRSSPPSVRVPVAIEPRAPATTADVLSLLESLDTVDVEVLLPEYVLALVRTRDLEALRALADVTEKVPRAPRSLVPPPGDR
jgi:hypothetical protein